MKSTASYTSTLPVELMRQLNELSQRLKIPKNKIIEISLRKHLEEMKRQEFSKKNMETRLKKWRSGIEANISNLIRGFNLTRCNWKGHEHFKSKVL